MHAEVRVIDKVVSAGLGGQVLGRTRAVLLVAKYDVELWLLFSGVRTGAEGCAVTADLCG